MRRLPNPLTSPTPTPTDEQQRLHVRATPLAAIARGQLRWRHLFESEVLRHPGFIGEGRRVGGPLSLDARRPAGRWAGLGGQKYGPGCACAAGGALPPPTCPGPHPATAEFDDVNRVVLTRSADSSAFKVWDLRAPLHPLFSLSVRGVREVKIAAGGALLLIMEPEADPRPGSSLGACCLPLRVLDLQDGSLVQVR